MITPQCLVNRETDKMSVHVKIREDSDRLAPDVPIKVCECICVDRRHRKEATKGTIANEVHLPLLDPMVRGDD